jgi:hypothetical protein
MNIELWQLHKQRRELRREYFEFWQGSASETGTGRPIDAIIAPVAPYAAPSRHEQVSFHLFPYVEIVTQ